ncbi:hypothetical protein K474DRAFT_1705145 [Panus rudis PR-1116 ss-1]|nr:hypothetical protein K474DRAFT_1705145 [Panus rudis PR-1116 ss-1]
MNVLRTKPFAANLRIIRSIHASSARLNLVGPPDPVSNIRPVIYDDAPATPSDARHPYSLREFTGDTREYHWKMHRQQLDAFNHTFWADSNTRFEAAKQAVLDSLPESSTPEDREVALSDFYSKWLRQEGHRQRAYSMELRKRTWTDIVLGAKVSYQKFWSRITGAGASH